MTGISSLREHKHDVAKLWAKGLTCYEIGSQYGVSQKTVLNFASEDRETFPYRGLNEKSVINRIIGGRTVVDIEQTEYDLLRVAMAKDIVSVGSCECRWPVANGLFCAEETISMAHSYCIHHTARSRGKGTISERGAIRDAKKAEKR